MDGFKPVQLARRAGHHSLEDLLYTETRRNMHDMIKENERRQKEHDSLFDKFADAAAQQQ